jgi:DNA-binding beta-propeller fold protein YncE
MLGGRQKVQAQTAIGATFGDVITLPGGTPSDIVLDELRHVLYLVQNKTNQVLIFDYTNNQIVGGIPTGKTPLAGAISMDGGWLYVTCSGSTSLNVIDLSVNRVVQTVQLPPAPQGVEVGVDGRALVSMVGSGVVNNVPQGTLSVFDRTQTSGQQLIPVTVPALTTTLTPAPAQGLGRPTTTFTGKLMRTPDGSFIIGVITPTNASTYIFVYEVASGVILRNRTTAGQSSVISMSPDGSLFMAGFTM